MRIALYQMRMAKSEEDNLQRCLHAINDAARNGAQLILFPELTLHRFFPQYEKQDVSRLRIQSDHPWVMAFRNTCRANQIYATPNFYLEESGNAYDATLLIDSDGNIVGIQKMVHIAQAEQFYEQDYYTPSNDGFHVYDTPLGKIGIVVCFDRHYPESIRTESLRGADLILIPTANTKAEPMEMFEWEIRVQAFQNCVPIVMCNRVGTEDAMQFSGESLVVDTNGTLLAKANGSEQMLLADIGMQQAWASRRARPYTSLRRPDFYK